MTVPAQPPAAARTRKQAVTKERLDASRAVAYREQWCLRAPSRPSPDFGKKVTGRAVPYPTRSRCRRTPPHRNQNTTKTTLTSKDATSPLTLTLNGG